MNRSYEITLVMGGRSTGKSTELFNLVNGEIKNLDVGCSKPVIILSMEKYNYLNLYHDWEGLMKDNGIEYIMYNQGELVDNKPNHFTVYNKTFNKMMEVNIEEINRHLEDREVWLVEDLLECLDITSPSNYYKTDNIIIDKHFKVVNTGSKLMVMKSRV